MRDIFLSLDDLEALEAMEKSTWCAPWEARTFEIDCPCPNGEGCGDTHTCEEVTAPEEYPEGGQCVVQISVPGLERFAAPTAKFIAAARNAMPGLLAELRALRAEVANLRATTKPKRPAFCEICDGEGELNGQHCLNCDGRGEEPKP